MTLKPSIVIGTRGSALALRQTEIVVDMLRRGSADIEIVVKTVQTRGDLVQNQPISQLGDKGVFIRPLERALVAGEIDLAVHSLKDVPSEEVTPGLELAAFTAREDPRDVLVTRKRSTLQTLPAGSSVGTGSARRRMAVRAARDDLHIVDIRGNVDTRLRKLDAGEYDAIVLAAAGLRRLGLEHRISQHLPIDSFVPDAGQGILALQTRADDPRAGMVARWAGDEESRAAALAERAVVRALGADCYSPVGAHASIRDRRITVRVTAALSDARARAEGVVEGDVNEAEQLGSELGRRLLRELDRGQSYTEL